MWTVFRIFSELFFITYLALAAWRALFERYRQARTIRQSVVKGLLWPAEIEQDLDDKDWFEDDVIAEKLNEQKR